MLTGDACITDAGCGNNYETCSNGLGVVTAKSCPSDCSGHGLCEVFSTAGSRKLTPGTFYNQDSSDCVAKCTCDKGYKGDTHVSILL